MQFFVDALVGKTDIRPVYDAIASAHCQQNVEQERCLAEWRDHSKDIERVKIDVINFGWNSCKTSFNKRNTDNKDVNLQKLAAQFMRKYHVKNLGCMRS